jgi:hypothetical protein
LSIGQWNVLVFDGTYWQDQTATSNTVTTVTAGTAITTSVTGSAVTINSTATTLWTGAGSPNGADVAPHNMTSNTSPSPFAASCTNCSGTDTPGPSYAFGAFDGNYGSASANTQGWSTGQVSCPSSLTLDLGSGNAAGVGSFSLVPWSYNPYGEAGVNAYPRNFTLQGSNDNSTWTTVSTQTSISWNGSASQVQNFATTSTTAYRYFKLNVTANNGASFCAIVGEMFLYAANFGSGVAGDFYFDTIGKQLYGPRPSGSSPTWPLAQSTFPTLNGYVSTGTTFTASGCSNSTLVGGATAGSYHSGTTGTCTVTLTTGLTAPHGWSCSAQDLTTPADIQTQTATTTTTATLSGTTVSGDVVNFHCIGY